MEDFLDNKNLQELKIICTKLEINCASSTSKIKKDIINFLNKNENSYKKIYQAYDQIGNVGKEGIVYIIKDKDKKEFAMKQFRKTKSSKKLELEFDLQSQVSKYKICPQVYDVNLKDKYIIMEKMDKHLVDIMKLQNGDLTQKQQLDIIKIYQTLDKAKVFHGDSNILNYMYKNKKLYIIDFGMSSPINENLVKKLKTETPNFTIMTLGMIIKLKELKCPEHSYKYLLKFVSDENKIKYNL